MRLRMSNRYFLITETDLEFDTKISRISEQSGNYYEDPGNYIFESEPLVSKSQTIIGNHLVQVDFEETWDSIKNDLSLKFDLKNEFVSISVVFEYLKENYNVPAKKQ